MSHFFLPLLHDLHNNIVAGHSYEYSGEGQGEVTELFFPWIPEDGTQQIEPWELKRKSWVSHPISMLTVPEMSIFWGETLSQNQKDSPACSLQTRPEIRTLWEQNMVPVSSTASYIIHIRKTDSILFLAFSYGNGSRDRMWECRSTHSNPTAVCC